MNRKFVDERGSLLFAIKNGEYENKETTISINKKNVLRGIHQNKFEKLITCTAGKILDIIINPETKEYKTYLLDPNTDLFQVLVPANYGHAFLSLEEGSTIMYNFNAVYKSEETLMYHYTLFNFPFLPKREDLIISKNDNHLDYVIIGNGFLGTEMKKILEKENRRYAVCNARLEQTAEIEKFLDDINPKYVICAAGITGTPNIFWCDTHKTETIETNITYQLTLAKICNDRKIHLTVFGSAAIFSEVVGECWMSSEEVEVIPKLYKESDEGNFKKNFYSEARIALENIIKFYPNVLYLRINYPICHTVSPKNLITKLKSYTKVENCSFSCTYVNELFPICIKMIESGEKGICNFMNPGVINLIDIKKKLGGEFSINDFPDSKRSYAKCEIGMLLKYGVYDIEDAIDKCIQNYGK